MNAAEQRRVRERAANCCEYCRLPQHVASAATFQIEHIRARQHGGKTEPENLALACPRCNAYKGPNLTAIDPATDAVVPLFNPRTQSWTEHFALVGLEILGTSPTGRATAQLLCMNDPERLEMREIMQDRGELSW
jgi:hypothetical protein